MAAKAKVSAETLAKTTYVVLRRVDDSMPDCNWVLVGEAEAYNPKNAIKLVTEAEGTYVAVPLRSWKPTTRKIETTWQDVWS